MREPARDKGRLEDIVQAIDYAIQFAENLSFDEFVNDKCRYFAIVKNVEIVGEASYMLSTEFKENHSELPWKQIVNMRHVLVHGYTNIMPDILWETVQQDLLPLKKQVLKYLEELQ